MTTTQPPMTTATIELLWHELRSGAGEARQRRVDATHPHDLYADFAPPDHPGLVAVCTNRPVLHQPFRAIDLEVRRRADSRWALRISLTEPQLLPIFAALCRDIVAFTRNGVPSDALAVRILARIDRWRSLLEQGAGGLAESVLRGLIGELLVLDRSVMARLGPDEAVAAWTGPAGEPQDFRLPDGTRLEVKTVRRDAAVVQINGLDQLDAGNDSLLLVVVRVEKTGPEAQGAVTAPRLVTTLRDRLADTPDALAAFDAALASVGWHDDPSHDRVAVRAIAIDHHAVDRNFPRLIRGVVPSGIEDADYTVRIPAGGQRVWMEGE
ncbi:PD-(D/E)XK motif protein [Limobrevibacterium gyesilva]|uniref:PD-(D/E)XK motif protein n=1 Tax=Limobrevibacterium gyesilva TaxID=2991712 RepID=A0AA42CJC8_9PROT|nr:PD-(D/E)XK motif protein [Limobrevibacterium gyesilva]MCW3476750.1 PD-(D/E)XK motif protein [Limobrevibacterium gyesilva]